MIFISTTKVIIVHDFSTENKHLKITNSTESHCEFKFMSIDLIGQ